MHNDGPVVIVGHSLVAPENRLPFPEAWPDCVLIFPRTWRSPGNPHVYGPVKKSKTEIPLPTIGLRHNTLFAYRYLARTLDSLHPRLIYIWEEPWSLPVRQVRLWAQSKGIPWLFFSAENRPKILPRPFASLRNKAFEKASGAIVPTEEIRDNLMRQGYAGPVYEIPLWITARRRLIPASHSTVAFIGRFIALKRIDLLLQATALLPEIKLRLIGDGPEDTRLRRLARQLRIQDRVEFCGHVPNHELENTLQGCALVALPTGQNPRQAEQFGKAVLDGILSGLPVLVSDSGHLSHWAREFATVALANCSSPDALAQSIARTLEAGFPPQALVEAYEKAQKRYGPQAASLHFKQAFADTLSRHARRSS